MLSRGAVVSLFAVLSISKGQQWDSFAPSGDSDSGFFSRMAQFYEDLANSKTFGAPAFLRNVTTQARQEYYKILQKKELTRAQIRTAVANWAAANNVTPELEANNLRQQAEKSQFRAEVTAAVQKLPSLIAQLNAIDDDQRLTPSHAAARTRQIIHTATLPSLHKMALTILLSPSNGRDDDGKSHGKVYTSLYNSLKFQEI